jgi:hypothetical protein
VSEKNREMAWYGMAAAHTAWQGREWLFVISPFFFFFFFANKGIGEGGEGGGWKEILGTGSFGYRE